MFLELRLRKIRLKEQNKLAESNLYLYREITAYIYSSNLRAVEKEEVLQQIMDMMLEAQANNSSMDKIIGKDYEEFCKTIINEYNNLNNLSYKFLKYIQRYFIWLTFLLVLFFAVKIIADHSTDITIDELIFVNVWALAFLPFAQDDRKGAFANYFKTKNLSTYFLSRRGTLNRKLPYAFIISIVLIFGLRFLLSNIYGADILKHEIDLVKNAWYGLIIILGIVFIEIYKRFYDKVKY